MTESELLQRFPDMSWCKPVSMVLLGTDIERLACRICIALYGVRGEDIPALPKDREEFARHMTEKHNLKACFKNDN